MATSSVGYAGTITPDSWAKVAAGFGDRYGVLSEGAWKTSVVAGLDRTISAAAGAGFGHGIVDTTDAAETIQLDPILSGSRWDTIVRRRNWSTNTSTLVKLQGTSTKAIASGRLYGPGVIDDQPIALYQVTYGAQLPTGYVDLRCWPGDGGIVAASVEALAYLDAPGSVVWVDGVCWVRQVAANGTSSWVRVVPDVEVVGSALIGTYAGQRIRRRVHGKTWATDENGDVIVMQLAEFSGVLSAELRPSSIYPLTVVCRPDQGNLVARVWENGVRRTNTTFAAVADVHYW